jgi:hypothetical protein
MRGRAAALLEIKNLVGEVSLEPQRSEIGRRRFLRARVAWLQVLRARGIDQNPPDREKENRGYF